MTYWAWMIIGFSLIGIELAVSTFVTLWFGLAAITVGCLMLFWSLSITLQLVIWISLSVLGLAGWFLWVSPKRKQQTLVESTELLINQVGFVIQEPTKEAAGILRLPSPILGEDEWPFQAKASVRFGDSVRIVDVLENDVLCVIHDN